MASFLLPMANRRLFLQGAWLAGSALLGRQAFAAPEAAYTVLPWKGAAPSWQAVDTGGKTWRPEELKGRAVLLNFWAS